MREYEALARRLRPKRFCDVVGQQPLVATLQNTLKAGRVSHAYLFSGPRGTGKTTLARLLAKALNCPHRNEEQEPCNDCSSCREIMAGGSLEIIEVDGASNRGIEDIRQIRDAASYGVSPGRYRIYIIDEVHMLTKEAFNALLKTLEEPPPQVKFFFATTEPQKVPATIVSRCQRFSLSCHSLEDLVRSLEEACSLVGRGAAPDALRLIATRADGGMRDALSLLDQVLAFCEEDLEVEAVQRVLGIAPREAYFAIDRAGKEGDLAQAFAIVEETYRKGHDLFAFATGLSDHLRTILLVKLGGQDPTLLGLSDAELEEYRRSANLYRERQLLDLIEGIVEECHHLRTSPVLRFAVEAMVLRVLRSHLRVPLDFLVKQLLEAEEKEQVEPPKAEPPPRETSAKSMLQQQSKYDTMMQFAAVELGGVVRK